MLQYTKMHKFIFQILAILALPAFTLWGATKQPTYYAQLTVESAGDGQGGVYVATAETTNPSYQSAPMSVVASMTAPLSSNRFMKPVFFVYVSPDAKSTFAGFSSQDGTVTITKLTDMSAKVEVKSYEKASPGELATVTATFSAKEEPDPPEPPNPPDPPEPPEEEVVTVRTYTELLQALQGQHSVEIPEDVTIEIAKGVTVTVPDERELTVCGRLAVHGALVNNGTISGEGAIFVNDYVVTQTGGNDGSPIVTTCVDSSRNKKYYKTAVADNSGILSGNEPTCAVKGVAKISRGGAEIASSEWTKDGTPVALRCAVDASKAVNFITGFLETPCTNEIAHAVASVKGRGTAEMLVLLKDSKLSNSACKAAGLLAEYKNSEGVVQYLKLRGDFGTMDLAGKTLTVSPDFMDVYTHTVLNGREMVTTLFYSGTVNCINCSTVTFNTVKEDYASTINIYDCTFTSSRVVSAYYGKNAVKGSVNFLSGSTRVYDASQFVEMSEGHHIYGGKWKTCPDAKYIPATLAADYSFVKNAAGTWELQPKTTTDVVTLSTGAKFTTLEAAVAALPSAWAKANVIVMTLDRHQELANPITIPVGKTLEVELAGCGITAAKGFAVNHGTLILGDRKGTFDATGGRIVTTAGKLIENDGTVEITYGYYTGAINLTGGEFTTHHGRFTGSITAANKQYVNLFGGYFDANVAALLKEGFYRTSGFVGPFPKPALLKVWENDNNGGYWKYGMKTLPAEDLELFNRVSNQKSDYTLQDWKRRAELKSMMAPWLNANYMIDIVAGFDRDIAKNSAVANIEKPVGIAKDLPQDVSAGGEYRILSTFISGGKQTQKKYSDFVTDTFFQDSIFGISSAIEKNLGTTANLRIDLCGGSNDLPKSVHSLMSEYVVLGAGETNQAMIRPAVGAAKFYPTIVEAVSACAEGGTVMLCNDVVSTAAITVSKACTIETNGMEFKGSIVAGEGCELTATTVTSSTEKMIGKAKTTYVITKKQYPEDLVEADATLKAAFDAWVKKHGVVNPSAVNVNAFIVGLAPDATADEIQQVVEKEIAEIDLTELVSGNMEEAVKKVKAKFLNAKIELRPVSEVKTNAKLYRLVIELK